ncbi:hypothetical protein MNAN1_003010 [Malassezia nana]|uniref:Peroxin-14 n=1 Tax=Malassezia nana TaxID=180528 RepID=A0AAF0EKF1_9BASI|nr:hypothetical protein MNAN1_003010 [Malassezia nana]
MSGDGAGPSHAQAVRFLTSLRADSATPSESIVLTDEQRAFLHSKGMSDDAIERARQEAERPPTDALLRASSSDRAQVRDTSAFDRAKAAFDEPMDQGAAEASLSPPPPPPAASYPRSPLALYSEAPTQRDANEILSRYAATISRPRYDTLVTFSRMLHLLLMLGGGVSAVLVWLYRRHLLPRLTRMVDARVQLLSLQYELFGKVAEATAAYRDGALAKLLPTGYEKTYVLAPSTEAHETEEHKPAPALADAPQDAQEAHNASPKPASDAPPAAEPEAKPTPEPVESDATEASEPAPSRRVLAPIDMTCSLRESLDQLKTALRAATAASTPPTSVLDEDEEGLLDLTMPGGSPGSPRAPPLPAGFQHFRTSFDSMRNELEARLFSEAEAIQVLDNRFSALAGGSGRATSATAVEMRQIKAEIRSLKGLMLSRRNFPSYLRAVRSTPSPSPQTTS